MKLLEVSLYDLHANPKQLKGYEQRFQVPDVAYEEAIKIYGQTANRSPELEKVFAKDPELAYKYATKVLHARFEEGEPAIAKNSQRVFYYARFLHERFPQGEQTLLKDPDPRYLYFYIRDISKLKWQEGLDRIAKQPRYSYEFARYGLHRKRFPQGEPAILTDPEITYHYAKHVLHTRWLRAEPILQKNKKYWNLYKKHFRYAFEDL